MSDKKDTPSKIRQALNEFVDKIMDLTESEDMINTSEKDQYTLRGQPADVYMIECRHRKKQH